MPRRAASTDHCSLTHPNVIAGVAKPPLRPESVISGRWRRPGSVRRPRHGAGRCADGLRREDAADAGPAGRPVVLGLHGRGASGARSGRYRGARSAAGRVGAGARGNAARFLDSEAWRRFCMSASWQAGSGLTDHTRPAAIAAVR